MKMNKQYLNASHRYPSIKFPEQVSSLSFEHILKECYVHSLKPNSTIIEFDFRYVRWCDVFALSLLALWILELKDMGKRVIFQTSIKENVQHFLSAYYFDKFLISEQIELDTQSQKTMYGFQHENHQAPYFPLTFFNESQFRQTIENLLYSNRLEILLRDIKEKELVKSGIIRDIVLKELGDNIFNHAGGRFAHVIMTKFGADSPEKAQIWAKAQLSTCSPLEQRFFQNLYGHAYLTLVIGDKGKGIRESLLYAYEKDQIIENKKESPSEKDILEYAFLYHSSRRSIDERIGAIKKVISSDIKKFPPPTGLFRLKEVVKEFRGFLHIRSGASIVCYDFYSDPHTEQVTSNENIRSLKRLSDFGGTQYKLYFPVDYEKGSSVRQFLFNTPNNFSTSSFKYDYISLEDYSKIDMSANTEEGLQQEAVQLHEVFERIEQSKLRIKHSPSDP